MIHLGDYIYEYATGSEARPVQPEREIFTLYDYRRRLATYRTDLDLLLSHATFPWIPVWDDHEIANSEFPNQTPHPQQTNRRAVVGWLVVDLVGHC